MSLIDGRYVYLWIPFKNVLLWAISNNLFRAETIISILTPTLLTEQIIWTAMAASEDALWCDRAARAQTHLDQIHDDVVVGVLHQSTTLNKCEQLPFQTILLLPHIQLLLYWTIYVSTTGMLASFSRYASMRGWLVANPHHCYCRRHSNCSTRHETPLYMLLTDLLTALPVL